VHRLDRANRQPFPPEHDPLVLEIERLQPAKRRALLGERPGRTGLQQALVGEPVAQVVLELGLEPTRVTASRSGSTSSGEETNSEMVLTGSPLVVKPRR